MSEYDESIEMPEGYPDADLAAISELSPSTDEWEGLTEQDRADLEALGLEPGQVLTRYTILKVWKEALAPAHGESGKRVTPQWCSKMVQTYPQLRYGDCNALRDSYYAKLFVMMELLDEEIATDDQCLTWTTPEEDLEHNAHHYKNLLTSWQKQFLTWELEWRCFQADAAVELAALSEVHKILFGSPERTGLTAFLSNIQLEITESDHEMLAKELEAVKIAYEEEQGE